ncbi:hypothetical protein [Chryseobacterium oncorhynchi]|uniref:Transmembrane Fragile-X-F protein n=1 Tax=Chryseobacterium oncorhynchi TaxID=741074 RepID=A0A316WLZ9_9FLAO|nr:hypothetical protein [Chryseobacterium oncorhynchi]PWN62287.1 hypothetical protein C1638_017495 [Chryseobacterium oncorhynchi]
MSNTTNTNYGISFPALLGIVFIVLKLTHVIDWSWWWVTAPFWGSFALAVLIFIIYGIALLFGLFLIHIKRKR